MDVLELIEKLERQRDDIARTIETLREASGLAAPKTQWDYVKMALERERSPMSVPALIELMKKLGYQSVSKNPVSVLAANTRNFQKRGLLVRFGRGLWGLPEWQAPASRKVAKAMAKKTAPAD